MDSNVQHLVDRKGRLWQERTIVVKPDRENGYGFSLSGEKPVFVGCIEEEGPAYQAGIRKGDRIIKVDSSAVFDKKHEEVIVLLKGAASVSLTIIRVVTPSKDTSRDKGEAPRHIQELTVNNLKAMLQKQQRHFEQLTIDYTKSPAHKLEQELKDCEEIMKSLMGEIAVKTNSSVETVSQTTESKVGSLLGPEKAIERQGRLARDDSMLAHKILNVLSNDASQSQTNSVLEDNSIESNISYHSKRTASPTKFKSPKSSRRSSISKLLTLGVGSTEGSPTSGSSSPTKGHLRRSLTELNDSDLSDEDLEFGIPQFGPFSSLQELNNYPAHMSVFLHYLIQNKDPRYLCFYLVARSYQNFYKGNDLRQKAMEILWTFCLQTSPLYVQMSEGVLQRILETLELEDNEIKLKSIFVEARDVVANQIAQDLAEFRHKRTLGLGSMYGEQKLTDHMTNAREVEVANSMLSKVVKALSNEKCDGVSHINRNQAICDSLSTFLSDVGKGKSKSDSMLSDRVQSFTRPEPKRSKKLKKISKCSHSLQLTSYHQITLCDYCEKVLWGVGHHGYQCLLCEMNFHRYGCIDERLDPCKKEKKKTSTTNSRKTSGGTQSNNSVSTSLDFDQGGEETIISDQEVPEPEDDDHLTRNRSRLRSVSDPKNTLMAVNLARAEEEIIKENMFSTRKTKPSVTVNRTQSLKERTRSGGDGHPHSSQDTSLNTTPSWNSVASSTSDESLNTTQPSVMLSGGVPILTRASTLDTVIEGGDKYPSIDDHIVQELQEANVESELVPWRLTTKSHVVKGLMPFEIQRQELLKELIHTERTHRKKLLIMKHIYKTPLCRQKILTHQQAEMLFPSLEEIVNIHNQFCEEMRARQLKYSDGVIREMADIILSRFEGEAGEKLCKAASVFASNQTRAVKNIKEFSAKNIKFKRFLQDAESDPYCNRLKLQELVPIVWTRITRCQLLIENICKLNKKNKDKMRDEDREEAELMDTALMCVKNVCKYVNRYVKQEENLRHLRDYQSKLDTTSLEKTNHPIAEKYKDLNLTAENRKLLHEGVLSWKISQRKTVEVHALLLTDILVLLSKAEDGSERLLLKMYHFEGVTGVRDEISPVIRLKEMLFRDRADRVGRTFLIVNHSSLLKLAQMYEFTAESVQEKKKWEKNIENATAAALGNGGDLLSPEPHSPTMDDSFSRPVTFTPLIMSSVSLRDQLDKIDEEIQKLMEDKLAILKGLQGDRRDSTVLTLTPPADKDFDGVKDYTCGVLETVSEVSNQVSKLMVPNPTKHIVADVQYQLTELSSILHKNLSHVVVYLNESLGSNDSPLENANSPRNVEGSTRTSSSQYSSVLEEKTSPPRYEDMSDATVSPMEDSILSNHITDNTPQATPLPSDSYRLHPVATDATSSTPKSEGGAEMIMSDQTDSPPHDNKPQQQYTMENNDDEDDEDLMPPPLPMEPPPSSTSASSQNTNPDIDESEFLPPPLPPPSSRIPHSISGLSDEFHAQDSSRIVEPPAGFLSSSPEKGRHHQIFTIPKDFCESGGEDDEHGSSSPTTVRKPTPPHSSPTKDSSPSPSSFRRVRSNPSLSSLKVKMSVISSSGNPVSSLTNLEMSGRQNSEGIGNQYVVKLKS